ncbi:MULTISPECIES: GHMP kinase [Yersinia]|uniref:GHMP family kinase ATP-binding protein n=1 Tax=Yersinia TaxID=629 RepID=UPI0005E6BB78|nr:MULTISPECIES: GHMP kinase [Yersinia]RXA93917.1 GHMP kinase [Yersinia sp. 2105 StPb PI]CNI91341.1 PduX [Yersinia frederiksenii]CNJ08528.1 PduX [Yersinia frederiksenii]CNK40327.1 PduX [Yersinia frederiksenii]
MAEAHCPASCGELLQGWILGGEKLISCPINWYSNVSVTQGKPGPRERPRMRQMVKQVLAHFDQSPLLAENICIEFESTIPVAKGLASSTADIAATAMATSRLLGQPLSDESLAQLCVALEPTDSTIFKDLTLFDHQTAQTQLSFPWLPDIDIVLLESSQTVLTEEFHQRKRHSLLLKQAPYLVKAMQQFRLANERRCCYTLGEATTLSAIASESLLPKPQFYQLLDIVEHSGIYGLNVAHSGSVIGLLLNHCQHDVERLLRMLHRKQIIKNYPRMHLVKMVAGGVR